MFLSYWSCVKYIYVVKLDSKIYQTKKNTNAVVLTNVEVFASSNDIPAVDGVIRNLQYSSEDTTGFSYIGKLSTV